MASFLVYFLPDGREETTPDHLLQIFFTCVLHSTQQLFDCQRWFHKNCFPRMASQTPRPINFPLSNASQLSECTFAEALRASGRSIIFFWFPYPGRRVCQWGSGQASRMYIFPDR
ncbi:hypothetical protein EDD16DRAFT_874754 [Pisolithus croceorrhizus]|nr:hypothetical protein EDD16DRAFT_874754 [Pisolithus croceorrhizus]KAI6168358.1 hypothetical protein EDD17DRAFT_1527086 [Pisolithus thermaeus]